MPQSHIMTWTNPTTDTDGNPYVQAQNAGYTIAIDGQPGVSVPLAYGTSFDIGSLAAVQALKSGQHQVSLALVTNQANGGVTGVFSAPATFPIFPTPTAPGNLAIS